MMRTLHSCLTISLCMAAALCCSCQQHVMAPSRASVGSRTYSDAVVHIGQVDPAYRPYFQSQHGANYSLEDQRKAYLAAAQTARTPVRETDYRPSVPRNKKVAQNRSKSKTATAAKKKSATTKRSLAVKKRTTRRR